MNDKIEKIQAIYNPDTKKYEKAFVTINGKTEVLEDNIQIMNFLKGLKAQEGKSLNEIGTNKLEVIRSTNPVAKDKEVAWSNAARITNGKINKNNPHTGKKTKNIDKKGFSKTKKVIYSAVLGVATLALVSCGANKISDAFTKKTSLVSEKNGDEDLSKEIKDPESWEEYMTGTYNPEAEQKMFAKFVMDNQIIPNIKTKTIDNKTITYGLTPEQAMAWTLYYNSNLYSNEKMLAILGDYSITGNSDTSKNIINQVNDANEMIRLSWALADNKEEMIIPEVEDKVVQDLINKYVDLIVEYKNANTSKEKKNVKAKIEKELEDDFITAENGVINLQDHPAAHIILNTIPAVFSTMYDPIDEDINKILVGTEANYDVDLGNGKSINIPETGGLVDQPCAIYIARFEEFENYRNKLEIDKMFAERTNQGIYTTIEYLEESIAEAKESIFTKHKVDDLEKELEARKATLAPNLWEEITVDTYEYDDHDEHKGQLIPWMEEAVLKYGLDNIENMQAIFREAAFAEVNTKKNGGKFNPHTNPAGGKKGDTYVESQGRAPVSKDDLINNYVANPDEVKAAEDKANQAAGTVTEEQGKQEAEDIQKTINEMGREPYYYFKKNGPSAGDLSWANHPDGLVRSHYNTLKQQGIAAYKIEHESVKEDNTNGDNTPEHKDNPNQNNNKKPEENNTPQPEEDKKPQPEENKTPQPEEDKKPQPEENKTPQPEEDNGIYEDAPSHEDNLNQQDNSTNPEISVTSTGSSSVDVVDSDTIEGTVTTDDSDVWDPSSAGVVESDSYFVLMQAIDEHVEALANYPEEVEEEVSYQKTM